MRTEKLKLAFFVLMLSLICTSSCAYAKSKEIPELDKNAVIKLASPLIEADAKVSTPKNIRIEDIYLMKSDDDMTRYGFTLKYEFDNDVKDIYDSDYVKGLLYGVGLKDRYDLKAKLDSKNLSAFERDVFSEVAGTIENEKDEYKSTIDLSYDLMAKVNAEGKVIYVKGICCASGNIYEARPFPLEQYIDDYTGKSNFDFGLDEAERIIGEANLRNAEWRKNENTKICSYNNVIGHSYYRYDRMWRYFKCR